MSSGEIVEVQTNENSTVGLSEAPCPIVEDSLRQDSDIGEDEDEGSTETFNLSVIPGDTASLDMLEAHSQIFDQTGMLYSNSITTG